MKIFKNLEGTVVYVAIGIVCFMIIGLIMCFTCGCATLEAFKNAPSHEFGVKQSTKAGSKPELGYTIKYSM
jgi:hypothetical protein